MLDKVKGCMLGLAVGDALGTTLEFTTRDMYPPLKDIVGGGPFNLAPGEWTDDTSLALCMLASLVIKQGYVPTDHMNRFVKWYKDGYLSSNGICFDIGYTTMEALEKWIVCKTTPYCGNTATDSAGNGSIMRLAPVPIYFRNNPELAILHSGDSSRTTHGASACVDACRYMAGILIGAMYGESKAELLRSCYHPVKGQWWIGQLHEDVELVAQGHYKDKVRAQIKSTGYVIDTLEAALWAFFTTKSFEEGALKVVNLGGDADTTGAVYGQIAGAFYGLSGIPEKWVNKLAHKDMIMKMVIEMNNRY